LVKTIGDRDVREFYGQELAKRLNARYGGGVRDQGWQQGQHASRSSAGNRAYYQQGKLPYGRKSTMPAARITPQLRQMLAASQNNTHRDASEQGSFLHGDSRREATLVLALYHHPDLLDRREAEYLRLDLADPALSLLLSDIMSVLSGDTPLDTEEIKRHLSNKATGKTLERILSDRALNSQKFLQAEAQIDEVDWGFDSALSHHAFETSLKEEYLRATTQIFQDREEMGTPEDFNTQKLSDQNDMDGHGVVHGEAQNSADSDRVLDGVIPEGSQGVDALSRDDHWKELARAREELINKNRASARSENTQGGSSDKLASVLERMKSSVSKSGRKASRK